MSYIQVEPMMAAPLTQEITILRRCLLVAIRPRLYFHNDPTGTYTLTISDGVNVLGTKSYTMAQIISGAEWTAGQYHHGVIKFDFASPITLNPETYTISISATGYTFTESSYMGWIRDHEDLLVEYTGTVNNDAQKPFGLEIWSYV